jgi:cation:H+ antiporter
MFDSLLLNISVFAVSAGGLWFVASKLTVYLDIIAERTGLGRAMTGLLLLGISTSLPEIVTTATASVSGEAQLAGSNLLGGIAIQIAVLAMVDLFALRRQALTSMAPKSILLMQGVVLVMIITLTIAAISMQEIFSFQEVGLWPVILLGFYIASVFIVYRYEINPRWSPSSEVKPTYDDQKDFKAEKNKKYNDVSTKKMAFRAAWASLGILITGYIITKSAEGVVEQAGLSSNFIGATFLALATSLPEVTTTWSAIKIGAFTMAIANILGTNTIEAALLFPADIFYREGPIINELGNSSIFLASLGILLTCVYLWGILEQRNKTFLGMGVDSAIVLFLYFAGMTIYYFI